MVEGGRVGSKIWLLLWGQEISDRWNGRLGKLCKDFNEYSFSKLDLQLSSSAYILGK